MSPGSGTCERVVDARERLVATERDDRLEDPRRDRVAAEREADRLGKAPPVVDSEDVRRDPRGTLSALCAAIDLEFSEAMLAWPKGQHPDDGVWAPHWYGAIFDSTGFAPPDEKVVALPGHLRDIADEARVFYERMAAHKG